MVQFFSFLLFSLEICYYFYTNSGKPGSSPGHLPLEVRFKIAKGVARGLAFIHGKKHVHGNIKPNNILLNLDMEPIISDFGLDRLVFGNNSSKASSSSRHFSSQRFAASTQEHSINAGLFSPSTSSAAGSSPYQAPESLNNPKGKALNGMSTHLALFCSSFSPEECFQMET
ncbi:hypothetical protein OIU77_016593 [Salix suchowensis]|uniref:Protein kinase domain-containing protein n=1 Tax=Salix suchowensis TaxID=1278906 RepID=A0ABQ8ZLA6_9ROSI|nr:hypothetical protein OIU77_016593 [Salix suchowensis]